MKLAVLASHEGTTLQAILDACAAGAIPCQVVARHQQQSRVGSAGTGAHGRHLRPSSFKSDPSRPRGAGRRHLPGAGRSGRRAGRPRRLHEARGPADADAIPGAHPQHASRPSPQVRRDGHVRSPRSPGRARGGRSGDRGIDPPRHRGVRRGAGDRPVPCADRTGRYPGGAGPTRASARASLARGDPGFHRQRSPPLAAISRRGRAAQARPMEPE